MSNNFLKKIFLGAVSGGNAPCFLDKDTDKTRIHSHSNLQENDLASMRESDTFRPCLGKPEIGTQQIEPSVVEKDGRSERAGSRSRGALTFFGSLAIGTCVALLSAGDAPSSDVLDVPDTRIAALRSSEEPDFPHQKHSETSRNTYKKIDPIQNYPLSPYRRIIYVKQGSGLMRTLLSADVPFDDARDIIAEIGKHIDLRKIPAGQPVEMVFPPGGSPPADGIRVVEAVIMEFGGGRYARAVRSRANGWNAEIHSRILHERGRYAGNRIDTSLFAAAEEAGLPHSVTNQFIRIFSHIVDFQRDLRKGDEFKVFYTQKFDVHGTVSDKKPLLLYVSLSNRGRQKQFWLHTDPETGIADYFDSEGRSMKRLLMRTPIDGARMSSGYGMRLHPILGYSRMHQGLDFAAPTGTPVFASGNGVVVRIGNEQGYGRTIRLRHANHYATVYAHLGGYAKALKVGSRVEQGQTIGYVGSTGLSTGPHLHYEVHLRGKSIDPHSLDIPLGRVLEGAEMAEFQEERVRLERLVRQSFRNGFSSSSSVGVAYR